MNFSKGRVRLLQKDAKIYVAGMDTLMGTALLRELRRQGYSHVLANPEEEPDLTDAFEVDAFFNQTNPDYIFLVAGKSGGIGANQKYPAELMRHNLLIECHVMQSAYRYQVKKLLFLASSCSYPKYCPQPMKEEALLTGLLEPTSEAYAVAKIAGIKLCQAYRQQYGVNFIAGLPANPFGPGDDFSLEDSHVIASLIRKMHEAKINYAKFVEIWGTGSPQREFIFADDLAEACIFIMDHYDEPQAINLGSGQSLSIKDLALTIKEVTEFGGEIHFDPSKADGMPMKLLDCGKLEALGWYPRTPFRSALMKTYKWFQSMPKSLSNNDHSRRKKVKMAKKKMRVPFGTISIPEPSKRLIGEILETKRVSSGKYVRMFEEKFAEVVGMKEAVALSSGTDADILALAVLHDFGAQRGDEVILPALSFVATGNAAVHSGFTPVFVDIHRDTLNMNPDLVEAAITGKTRAIMPVHLMGKPAEMDAINAIARKHKLYVIEDAAEAHGALYKGRPVGGLANMGAFSLYVAHIITTGEGGIVVTDNEDFAETLRSLRSHGRACKCKQCTINITSKYCPKRFQGGNGEDIRFVFERIGYSCKMNELEAAIGLGNIEFYHDILNKRRRNLLYVLERFKRFCPYLVTIEEGPEEQIGPHAIPIIIQEEASFSRAELTNYLEGYGIETRTLFASMPTQCAGFAYLGYKLGQFPHAEFVGTNGLHIGVHQDLGLEEMEYVLDTIDHFLELHQR